MVPTVKHNVSLDFYSHFMLPRSARQLGRCLQNWMMKKGRCRPFIRPLNTKHSQIDIKTIAFKIKMIIFASQIE